MDGRASKKRSRIPEAVAAEVLFRSHHTCCVCREAGKAVQIHHLNENPADHRPDNLAVLCLEDHHRTQVSGGFGRHLGVAEVRRYREDWVSRVEVQRKEAAAKVANNIVLSFAQAGSPKVDDIAYLLRLPSLKAELYRTARVGWGSSVSAEMNLATYQAIDGLSSIWLELSQLYPEHHFGLVASQFIAEFEAKSFRLHRSLNEPGPPGSGGTVVGQVVAGSVLSDVDRLVANTVEAIYFAFLDETFDLPHWRERWAMASNDLEGSSEN